MKILITLITSLFFTVGYSQVVINEFSASNLLDFPDNYGRYEDWIELYNTGDQDFDLAGWGISDNENKPMKWVFPENSIVSAQGSIVLLANGRDEVSNGFYHTNFKLKQTKYTEEVVLSNPDSTIVEMVPLGITQAGHSWARSVDGGGEWMVSMSPTFGSTNEIQSMIKGYAPPARLSRDGGIYQDSVSVGIANYDPAYIYRYTLDGDDPIASDPEFPGFPTEMTFTETTVIKLRAFPRDQELIEPGLIDFSTLFINEEFTLPVFSIVATDIVDLANGQGELIPIGSLEYFSADGTLEAKGYGELNRHGQDSWVNKQRSLDWITRDEMGYTAAIEAELFSYSKRDEYQRFMFRASGDDNYPATDDPSDLDHQGSCHIRDEYVHELTQKGKMSLDQRAVERSILFLNGQYWGVYAHREKPDEHDYTGEYYDQGKYDLQYLQTWGETWAQYGGQEAIDTWVATRDLALNNDMSDPTLYEQLTDQLNMKSLIDYMTTNLMAVSSDWLNYNTGWWRGTDPDGDHKKWGYIMWDNDATFDYYINYSGVPNTDPDAVPCDIEDISSFMDSFFGLDTTVNVWNGDTFFQYPDVGRHEKIFLKLLEESDEFEKLYYQRSADHMNTIFSCENMNATLDSMLNTFSAEMPRHIARWGGSMTTWEANVTRLKTFVNERCGLIDDGIVECYDLTGPFNVVVMTEPPGAGEIKFNTVKVDNLPWSGDYFGNMENTIEVKSTGDLAFGGWKATAGTTLFDNNLSSITNVQISEPDTIIAVFGTTVATNDIEIGGDLTFFPNPATDQLTISLPDEIYHAVNQIVIYNSTGKQVYGDSNLWAQESISIDLSTAQLPSGTYTAVMYADSNLYRGNFVIVE